MWIHSENMRDMIKTYSLIAELFGKNLINYGVHYILILQNIIDGSDKNFSGERVTRCNSHFRLIGF